ncbi:MAG: GNAT family N-acetyltransferase [Luteolibacter sp.]
MIIASISECNVDKLDELGRRYRRTIGFLTRETLLEYLRKNRVLGAWTETGKLVGYLLFADYPDRFRIAQLCVDEEFRGEGIARQLIEALKALKKHQKVIKLRCRRDFPAHHMWLKLGFIPLSEKAGRSSDGHPLTLWCYRLDQDDELGLWKAEESDEVLNVAIDAQIFYDFYEEESTKSLISKGLRNDFLVDSLKLWITDELFVEIDRHGSSEQRRRSMERAHGLDRVYHDRELAEQFAEKLKGILPWASPNQLSDINHLAKTAASDIGVFVTRDERLIKNAVEIQDLIGLRVIHPIELITSLHEETEKQSYSPSRVSGMGLVWKRMSAEDCSNLQEEAFCNAGESKGRFVESLRSYLSQPDKYICELLRSNGLPTAIRVVDKTVAEKMVIKLARLERVSNLNLFGQFLIADTLSLSISEGRQVVTFEYDGISRQLEPVLLKMGFVEDGRRFVRFTFSEILSKTEAIRTITSLVPSLEPRYRVLSGLNLEQHCAPLVSQEDLPCFIIPIQPTFAMGLLDRAQSAEDLFGGDPSVLLRWENVYYRKKSCHKMLRAPARILWYVSGKGAAVVAVSHLDHVEIDVPKSLFRKYQRFGILEWKDVFKVCGKDITKEIMVLKFSRTFTFRHRITLDELRGVFGADGIGESLQSPSSIPFATFAKLFQLGFPDHS